MTVEENRSTTVVLDGKSYLYFGGTNYLGIAHRPELSRAATAAFDRFGFSAGASRLTSGENSLMLELEKELAAFAGSESAIVLPAGYMGNSAVVDALEDLVDAWVIQERAHGSIQSAIALSRKQVITDDPASGGTIRERHSLPESWRLGIFAEPVEPMSGRLFDCAALERSAQKSDFIILDEAHSFGVLGDNGVGALQHFDLKHGLNLVRTGTFSKALGSYGGFVVASNEVVAEIKRKSHLYKSSTALSPVVCGAAREALNLLVNDKANTIDRLKTNIAFVIQRLEEIVGADFCNDGVPIFFLRNSPEVAKLRDSLPGDGIYIPTVSSYFADFCQIGLRWTIQSGHSKEQLERFISQIAQHVKVVERN
jgi:7-keto-8-aminopelargonate synthetase-like enzyme